MGNDDVYDDYNEKQSKIQRDAKAFLMRAIVIMGVLTVFALGLGILHQEPKLKLQSIKIIVGNNGNGDDSGGDNNGNDNSSQGGLGRLTDGRGYFPSLVTLQYQGSIPDPSPSIFVTEGPERERLKRILNLFFFTLVVYAIMC